MKKNWLYIFAFQLLCASTAYAQNIPTGITTPTQVVARPLPYMEPASPYYQRSIVPLLPIQDATQLKLSTSIDSAVVTTQYFDYLRRPVQTISKQVSPNKKDNVTLSYFDEFGRASTQYLPYTAQTGNTDDGKYKQNPFAADSAFYKNLFPNEQINYGQQQYDGSPLNRVIKATGVGNSFTGANVGKSKTWRANTALDSVILWTIPITNEDDVPIKTAIYANGSLLADQTTDEKGIKTIVYKDEQGKTILVKQQLTATPSAGHTGWLCTYYVYDEMNHLRLMLPPKAVEQLAANNWVFTTPILNGLCYSYFYDVRGRTTIKRIPGKGKFYTAYDLLDRVVMTQDPNLRTTNRWAFLLYDGQDRPVKSGLITSALTKDVILAQASTSNNYPTLTGTYTITSESYYDDYSWIAASGTSLSSTISTTNINATNFNTSYNTAPEYAQPIVQSKRIRGAVTGTKKIILGSSAYLYSVSFYDDNSRTIQAAQTNSTGGTDVSTIQYSFTSKVLRSHAAHQKAGTNAQTHTLLTKYQYDHIGRIKNVVKNFDNTTNKTLAQFTYNELGQVQTKVLAPTGGTGGTPLETLTYAYNIQGAMVSTNAGYVTGSGGGFFGEILSYDYGFTNPQLDGNIAGVRWKTAGDKIARSYGFSYDNANRLTVADFSQQNEGSTNWTKDKVDYTVSNLNYDANGNILTMKQRGLQINTSATIDSLSYQYFTSSNQLQKVTDGITDLSPMGDFKDTTTTTDDYTYDANGNINKDNNRHMHTSTGSAGAIFNILDKPDSITINGKSKTYYTYDAGGSLIKKQVLNLKTNTTSTYVYVGAYIYKNDTLQTVFHEEGQIRKNTAGVWAYDYFIKDYQGNIRTVLTEDVNELFFYAASMEPAAQTTEDALFTNIYTPTNTVLAKPSGFDANNRNTKVSRLNGNTSINKKTGPGIVLKVMAGDKVQLSTYAFYNTATQAPLSGVNLLSDILSIFTGGVLNNSGGKVNATNSGTVNSTLSPNVTDFLNNNRPYNSTRPKAFLNWILVDNQFKLVSSSSSAMQVVAGSSKQVLAPPMLTLPKSGYLYVYVSNESPQDVYFDDVTIQHLPGALVQEQSFYPFGLQMSSISDKAALKANTPYKYNGGVELEEDGIDYYNTFYRKYDAQIGRFTGVDMMSEETHWQSTYQFGNNNPILFNDPMGDLAVTPSGKKIVTSKGPDGNTYVSWYSEMLWNGLGFFDTELGFGGTGGGGNGSGIYENFFGVNQKQVLAMMNFGDKLIYNKFGQLGFFSTERRQFNGAPGQVGVAAARVWHSLAEPPDKSSSLYRTPNGEITHTAKEWAEHYKGKTWNDITTDNKGPDGDGFQRFLFGLVKYRLGPVLEWRFVKLNDGRIMDMRHVLVVGMKTSMGYNIGPYVGAVGEIGQIVVDKKSFNQKQDYFSNSIGSAFLYYLQQKTVSFDPAFSTREYGNGQERNISSYFESFINGN
jgi:RHS repeat-associated protein